MVSYFAKTIFTPVGLDILCKHEEGLSKEMVDEILNALKGAGDDGIQKLAGQMFKVGKAPNTRTSPLEVLRTSSTDGAEFGIG